MDKNIIVLDTETVGTKNRHLLDIGYIIINFNGNEFKVIKEFNCLVSEVIDNVYFMENDTFIDNEKYSHYLNMLKKGTIKKHKLKTVFNMIEKDMKKHKVEYMFAYNSGFDSGVFKSESEYNSLKNPFDNIQVVDLWALSCKYIVSTQDYYDWAIKNNQLTASRLYISSGVESVIKYLSSNLEFEEEHRALSDSRFEFIILQELFKRGANIFDNSYKKKLVESNILNVETIEIDKKLYEITYSKTIIQKNIKKYYKSSIKEIE